MKLRFPTLVAAIGVSTAIHLMGGALLVETKKKAFNYHHSIVTLTLNPVLAEISEAKIKIQPPLSHLTNSLPSSPATELPTFAKRPEMIDPEFSVLSIPAIRENSISTNTNNTTRIPHFKAHQVQSLPGSEQISVAKYLQNAPLPTSQQKSIDSDRFIVEPNPPTPPRQDDVPREPLSIHPNSLQTRFPSPSMSMETRITPPMLSIPNSFLNTTETPLRQRNESAANYKLAHLFNQPPVYPRSARQHGIEGRVVLHVVVTSRGSPKDISIFESSGATILDEAALMAVAAWQFVPATVKSKKVESRLLIPIRFRLEN